MSSVIEVRIPDIGDAERVEVVEILVAPGERVERDAGLVTLESDKASMDVPSPAAGVVKEVALERGAEVNEGDLVLTLEVEAEDEPEGEAEKKADQGAAADEEHGRPVAEVEQESGAEEEPEEDEAAAESEGGKARKEPAPASEAATGAEAGRRAGAAPEPEGGEKTDAPSPGRRSQRDGDLHAEVLVLGSGPGGYTAAFRAADLGKRVVLVERYPVLGGVCLNVGCIPSKALLHVARVIEEAADLGDHGVVFGKPKLDLDALRSWKGSVVSKLTKGLAGMAKKRKVEVVQGTGRFTSSTSLVIEGDNGESTITFDAAIVAAGSRPIRIPGIPYDDPRVMESTGALELPEVPKRLLLVGGGIVGLEMAMVYGSLGAELTVVEMLDGLIPGCDRDLVRPLERRLKKRLGAAIHLGTRVAEIQAQKKGLKVVFEGEKAPDAALFDRVLVAVGRRPNGDRIGAEAAGLEVDERGFIPVDNRQRTNVDGIYAIGDIVGNPMLAHKATHEGKVAAEVAAGEKSAFDARVIPSVAYTDPEIAWVGLTETEAADRGIAYEKGAFPWAASGRSLGMGRDEGLTKILFDPETHKLLGGGVVGPSAGDLIAELALAIEMDCEAADLGLTIHPHPTLSETVAFAAEVYEGTVTDLYLPRRKKS